MLFNEKLKSIINIIDCSISSLSKESGISSSTLSRWINGHRIPKNGSEKINDLSKAILSLADTEEKHESVKSLYPKSMTLSDWLNEKSRQIYSDADINITTKHFSAEKFSYLLDLFKISNKKLAQYLNIDASLLSKYRTGAREPSYNGELISNICEYIAGKESTKESLYNFFADYYMMDNKYSEDIDYASLIHDYLYDDKHSDFNIIFNFLESLDNLIINTNIMLPNQEDIVMSGTESIYEGTDGLRKAVHRFLSSAITSTDQAPHELLLYSDQPMDWMTKDSAFSKLWSALMVMVLIKKNRIKVIHNIDRKLPEMLDALIKWMPLYLTGLIDAYYCKRSNDERFTHTLFINRDVSCVASTAVTGDYENALYHYYDEVNHVKKFESQFNGLFNKSAPLLNVTLPNNIPGYYSAIKNKFNEIGDVTILNLSIPVAINDRFGIFSSSIESCMITEYITITLDEKSYHESLLDKLLEYDNYNVIILDKNPFVNIEVYLKQGSFTMVNKTDTPAASFQFKHPNMIHAIEQFVKSLKATAVTKTKSETVEYLKNLITLI